MTLASHLTTGQVAEFFRVPEWRIRRIVDSLDCDIPRAGLYRMIPRDVLPAIAAKLPNRPAADGGAK
jgi:hypothetical protein